MRLRRTQPGEVGVSYCLMEARVSEAGLTYTDHVGAEETLKGKRDEDLEGKRAANGDQAEHCNDEGGGVDGVEGDVPLVVPAKG